MNPNKMELGLPPEDFDVLWRALKESVPGAVEEVKDTVFGPQRVLLDGTDRRRALIVESTTNASWSAYRLPTTSRWITSEGWKQLGRPDLNKERA